jgi:electron transfer flavoprotein alpha subunit
MMTSGKPAATPAKKPTVDLSAYRGVWVFVEMEGGHVHPVSWELIGEARKLADVLGVEVGAVICGPADGTVAAAAQEAASYGADRVYVAEHPVLAQYRNEPFTRTLTAMVEAYKPEILLLGATVLGRDLAGAVATTLATGLTADCTGLAIDPQTRALASTRPTFGGSLLCTIYTLNTRPQMATVRPRVMAMPDRIPGRIAHIVPFAADLREQSIVTKVIEFIPDHDRDKVSLAYADIVVAGGMGLGSPANFRLVRELARTLGGEYGCSRPVVQKGWLPAERQIGQTGKTIRPRLYIAAGISGAIQHRVGTEGADLILAINTDPNAPIFDFASHGIVADALTILPALNEALRRRAGAASSAAAE